MSRIYILNALITKPVSETDTFADAHVRSFTADNDLAAALKGKELLFAKLLEDAWTVQSASVTLIAEGELVPGTSTRIASTHSSAHYHQEVGLGTSETE